MKKIILLGLVLICLLGISGISVAIVPNYYFTVQGRLTDSFGNPIKQKVVNPSINSFQLTDGSNPISIDPSQGRSYQIKTDDSGVFNVTFGLPQNVAPYNTLSSQCDLIINTTDNSGNSVTFTQPLTSAPYAIRAKYADTAQVALIAGTAIANVLKTGGRMTGSLTIESMMTGIPGLYVASRSKTAIYGWSPVDGSVGVKGEGSIGGQFLGQDAGISVEGGIYSAGSGYFKGFESTWHGKNASITLENAAPGGRKWYLRSGADGTATPSGGFSIADDLDYRINIDKDGTIHTIGALLIDGGTRVSRKGLYLTDLVSREYTYLTALYVDNYGQVCKLKPTYASPDSSSSRYKHDISSYMIDGNNISKLNPVTFKWNADMPKANSDDFGLIAEDVYKLFPELVILNDKGQPDAIHYDKLSVVLLKAVQKQQKEIDALKEEISKLKK